MAVLLPKFLSEALNTTRTVKTLHITEKKRTADKEYPKINDQRCTTKLYSGAFTSLSDSFIISKIDL